MIKGSGVFDNHNKTLFECIKTFASEPDTYGTDFYIGQSYYGLREDNEYWYMSSTENGMDVLISNEELVKYFKTA